MRLRGSISLPLLLAAAAAFAVLAAAPLRAEQIRVAVAANFLPAMAEIVARFEATTGHEVSLSSGSTGSHYAQISNGAPFDAFFAADAERPALLEADGAIVPGSRFTYAVGRLALWSRREGYVDGEGAVLESGGFRHLAIANPLLAPYGAAARDLLQARGLWDRLQSTLVQGQDIGQAFAFVHSGNAELGFVAYAQLRLPSEPVGGSHWLVPTELHAPIVQQAVLLRDGPAAQALHAFMRSAQAREIIARFGYDDPASGP